MDKLRRAVIVPRVSTSNQAEEGTSLDAQELACLRKAQELGAHIHAIYRDEGVSGARYLTREGIQSALADIEQGRANVLITYKLDRAGRDVDILRDIKKRVERAGAELIFADGTRFEKNATGNLMFTQLAAFAEFEKAQIRERTMSGLAQRAKGNPEQGIAGVQPNRAKPPYGYYIVTKEDVIAGRYTDTPGSYLVVEGEAQWVREAFARFAAGTSLRGVCTFLNANKVPTPKGGAMWRPQTMRVVFQNPAYRGEAVYRRHETFHDERRITEGKADRRGMIRLLRTEQYQQQRPANEWITIPCPALVESSVWYACQALLAENRSLKGGNPGRTYMLSGLLRCPTCGRGMRGTATRKGAELYYTCNTVYAEGHGPKMHIGANKVERAVMQAVMAALSTPDSIAAALAAYEKANAAPRPTENPVTLRAELNQLIEREKVTATAQVDALMDGRETAVYDTLLREIGRKRSDLLERLKLAEAAHHSRRKADANKVTVSVSECLAALQRVLTAEELTNAEKKQALSGFVQAIHPEYDGVTLELKPLTVEDDTVQLVSASCQAG